MFSLFVRHPQPEPETQPAEATWLRGSIHTPPLPRAPTDPEQQVALVSQAVEKLNQVRQLVEELPSLPAGDRQEMLQQLNATAESLGALYFLDAIY